MSNIVDRLIANKSKLTIELDQQFFGFNAILIVYFKKIKIQQFLRLVIMYEYKYTKPNLPW